MLVLAILYLSVNLPFAVESYGVFVMGSVGESRDPVRISFDKSETHGAAVNSVEKPDKSSSTIMVSFYIFLCFCSSLLMNPWQTINSLRHTHTRLMALFRDYPGEPVPER